MLENKLIEDNYKLVWSIVNKFHYLKRKGGLVSIWLYWINYGCKKFDLIEVMLFQHLRYHILGDKKLCIVKTMLR